MSEHQRSHSAKIDRRGFLKASGAATAGLATAASPAVLSAGPGANRPNVLVIMTDQQHFDTIAGAGNPHLQTPALDQLRKRGASFEISYTANPVCSPARASLLTGRTSCETGVYSNGIPVRPTIPNLGQWLGEKASYESVYAGKWHLPQSYATTMPGFRVIHTGIGGAGYLCDQGVSMACGAFIRNRKATSPFMMFTSFMQPHDICEWLRLNMNNPGGLRYPEIAGDLPPLPPNFGHDPREPETLRKIRERNEPSRGSWSAEQWRYYRWSYYRHIEMVDGEIGRILQALRDSGQDENTIIVFTSDHGEGMGHHQMVRKSSPYDEASRVPLMISYPGRIKADIRDASHPASGIDVMPTLCDYLGIDTPPNMRGKSLRPFLDGREIEGHEFTVTESNNDTGRMVRTHRFKYVTYRSDPIDMFFDMQKDPGESRNLAADPAYADIVRRHRTMLTQWESRLDVAPNVPKSTAWWRRA